MGSCLLKNIIYKMSLQIIYIRYICIKKIWNQITNKGRYAIKYYQSTNSNVPPPVSDSKSPRFSWILRSILNNFNSAVVWMVSIQFLFQVLQNCSKNNEYNWYHYQFYTLQPVHHLCFTPCKFFTGV